MVFPPGTVRVSCGNASPGRSSGMAISSRNWSWYSVSISGGRGPRSYRVSEKNVRGKTTAVRRQLAGLAASDRREQAGEVFPARPAGRQVRGDTRVRVSRVLPGGGQFRVDVQGCHRLIAADIARVGAQEPL